MTEQANKTGVHNESRAEFNGTGETIDAAVSVAKPNFGELYNLYKRPVAVGFVAFVAGIVLKDKLVGITHKTASEVVEATE